jgi:mono/diheme cytochrome c family protein
MKNTYQGEAMKKLAVLLVAVGFGVIAMPSAGAAEIDAAAIYKSKCAACHGADGKGQTVMGKNFHLRDLGSEAVQKQKGEEIENIIANGKGKMPAYKGKLSEAEIDALVTYIRSFAPKK